MDTKKKICLGLLTNRGFKAQTVMSLLNMLNHTEHTIIPYLSPTAFTIAEHRNLLAARAWKEECDFLMMIDDDMVFPPETADILVKRDVDIIGVPFHTRSREQFNTVKPLPNSPASETTFGEVEAVGTGIIMIKTSVFEKIPQPYFEFNQNSYGMTLEGEDWVFCRKAREAGFKIWSEPLEDLAHIGDFLY